jgi:molybdopterin synthase catalytic subunit
MPTTRVTIQTEPFDVAAELARLHQGQADVGAVASFLGTMRGNTQGQAVLAMELEHYPGMTELAIEAMVEQATQRFGLQGATVLHRVGRLLPGQPIVLVATAAAHRRAAFDGCEFLMDYLKTQAPFWKKETTPEGAVWVDARVADDHALARWGVAVADNAGPAPALAPAPPGSA